MTVPERDEFNLILFSFESDVRKKDKVKESTFFGLDKIFTLMLR